MKVRASSADGGLEFMLAVGIVFLQGFTQTESETIKNVFLPV